MNAKASETVVAVNLENERYTRIPFARVVSVFEATKTKRNGEKYKVPSARIEIGCGSIEVAIGDGVTVGKGAFGTAYIADTYVVKRREYKDKKDPEKIHVFHDSYFEPRQLLAFELG